MESINDPKLVEVARDDYAVLCEYMDGNIEPWTIKDCKTYFPFYHYDDNKNYFVEVLLF